MKDSLFMPTGRFILIRQIHSCASFLFLGCLDFKSISLVALFWPFCYIYLYYYYLAVSSLSCLFCDFCGHGTHTAKDREKKEGKETSHFHVKCYLMLCVVLIVLQHDTILFYSYLNRQIVDSDDAPRACFSEIM